jgi:hypothetical protein
MKNTEIFHKDVLELGLKFKPKYVMHGLLSDRDLHGVRSRLNG